MTTGGPGTNPWDVGWWRDRVPGLGPASWAAGTIEPVTPPGTPAGPAEIETVMNCRAGASRGDAG
jgi:hypothetical protein